MLDLSGMRGDYLSEKDRCVSGTWVYWEGFDSEFKSANPDYDPQSKLDFTKGAWHRTSWHGSGETQTDRIVKWISIENHPYYVAATKKVDQTGKDDYELSLFDLGGNILASLQDLGCHNIYFTDPAHQEAYRDVFLKALRSVVSIPTSPREQTDEPGMGIMIF